MVHVRFGVLSSFHCSFRLNSPTVKRGWLEHFDIAFVGPCVLLSFNFFSFHLFDCFFSCVLSWRSGMGLDESVSSLVILSLLSQ